MAAPLVTGGLVSAALDLESDAGAPSAEPSRADAALDLARRGFRVLPVHNVITTRGVVRCTCPDPQKSGKPGGEHCADKGKHPRISSWQDEATNDEATVARWWARWPAANVGLAMGGPGRLVALDVDGEGGRASLAVLEAQHGPLPVTLTSRSGRVDGGEHLIFRVPDGLDLAAIPNRASHLAPGLDVRAQGGQIVVPPSVHESGRAYAWTCDAEPAELPRWLYELAVATRRAGAREGGAVVTAEKTPSPSAVLSGENPAYLAASLRDACATLVAASRGGRNDAANAEAYALGGLCWPGALDAEHVARELIAATVAGGWDADKAALTEGTIRAGLAKGQLHPRKIPPPLERRSPARGAQEEDLELDTASNDVDARLAAMLDGLTDKTKADRNAAVMADDALDLFLRLGERSTAFARLLPRLAELGIKMAAFKTALRARAISNAPVRRSSVDRDGRPRIVITEEEARINAQAAHALSALPDLYQRGHALVRVVESVALVPGEAEPVKRRSILPLELPIVREALTIAATWWTPEDGDDTGRPALTRAHPPDWCSRAVHAATTWPAIRHLTAIVECPILRPDGTILDRPGWDAATGILYLPPEGEVFPTVPENPTREEQLAARDLLLDVVRDFPFELEVHRAAWIAGLLTTVGRFAFSGPAPMLVVDGNTPGAGKSLLADAASLIVTGRLLARTTYADDENELRKLITCIALDASPMVLLDNVDRPLGDATLDAALTSVEWGERILGESSRPKLQLIATWWATGNNVTFKATIARRCIVIRLDSKEERPAERKNLRHLPTLIQERRPQLIAAALTLLRAWEATGRDTASFDQREPRPLGSYEGWAKLIQGAVMFAGLPDPVDAVAALDEAVHDQDAAGLAELLTGWEEAVKLLGGTLGAVTVQAVLAKLQDNDEARRASPGNPPPLAFPQLREALGELCTGVRPGSLPNVRQVSYVLRRLKKRVCGGRRLKSWTSHGGKQVWTVEVVGRVDVAQVAPSAQVHAAPVAGDNQ